jgi:hypothetical protein
MRHTLRFAILLLALLALYVPPASAQLFVVDEELYVKDVRARDNKLGTSGSKAGGVRGWVKLEGKTKIYRRNGTAVTQAQFWRAVRRGMKIRVHGGGDWDTNVVAKKIWY